MKTYTISELAREFQVTPRALRFYEDKGLLSPTRDGLNRVYSTRDRARLKLILQGKSVGFSLSDIREILDLYEADETGAVQAARTATPTSRANTPKKIARNRTSSRARAQPRLWNGSTKVISKAPDPLRT